jgi:hypothetical protein
MKKMQIAMSVLFIWWPGNVLKVAPKKYPIWQKKMRGICLVEIADIMKKLGKFSTIKSLIRYYVKI